MIAFIIRAIVLSAGGVTLLAMLGARVSSELAAAVGLLGGAGLAWTFAFARVRRGPFALPPLLAVFGAATFALAFIAAARPAAFYMPRWIVVMPAEVVGGGSSGDRSGDRVLGRAAQHSDVYLAHHGRYRAAFEDLFGVKDFGCPVDVVLPDGDGYATLAHAAGLDSGAASMGFAHNPPLGRRVVVHRENSGWGGIVHHLALMWTPCALPNAPPWVVQGVASLVEKHRLQPSDDASARFDLRYRSDWRIPESRLASAERDLQLELSTGDDQGFLRAFFLYLHERGHLRPLLARIAQGADATQALADVTRLGPQALEADWRKWLHGEARAIPPLQAAGPTDELAFSL